MKSAIPALLLSMLATACTADGDANLDCSDGKCDKPGGTVKEQCTNSRVNAMDEKRPHFIDTGVRWSCKDVNGVTASSNTKDDRGQEYCEYFTMLHTKGIPEIIKDSSGQPVFCDSSTPCGTGTCDETIFSCVTAATADTSQPADVLGKNKAGKNTVTPLDPKLTGGQLDWLSQNPDQKVGECVFTSWHADINTMPSNTTDTIGGYHLQAKTPGTSNPLFRMQVGFNSNGAAKALVQDCLATGDAKITDGFMRACTFCGDHSCVPWRKSDPSVCTMAMRIAECGCSINVETGSGQRALNLKNDDDLATAEDLFVPEGRRGFTLGTWDNIGALPTGCRYVKAGDPTSITVGGRIFEDQFADQTLVACDLKASHITAATAKDPKEACRQAYGDDVVVHVRAPDPTVATLKCDMTKPQCAGTPWGMMNLVPAP
jgi:hypothetical protein